MLPAFGQTATVRQYPLATKTREANSVIGNPEIGGDLLHRPCAALGLGGRAHSHVGAQYRLRVMLQVQPATRGKETWR